MTLQQALRDHIQADSTSLYLPDYFWLMNDVSGTTCVDAMGAVNLTYSGSPQLATSRMSPMPQRDNYAYFDGVDDYAQGTINAPSGVTAIFAWVYPVDGTVGNILSQMNVAGNNYFCAMFGGGGSGAGVVLWQTLGATHANVNTTGFFMPINRWSHVGFTFQSGTELAMYANGRKLGSTNSFSGGTGTSTNFRIGGRADGGGASWKGGIGPVWYSSATSAGFPIGPRQVERLYHSGLRRMRSAGMQRRSRPLAASVR